MHLPRCLALMTGEEIPAIGRSRHARMFPIRVYVGDIDRKNLATIQAAGQNGLLAQAMRGYIEWLIPQYYELPKLLESRFFELRDVFSTKVKGIHARSGDVLSWYTIGYEMMLSYWLENGIITENEKVNFLADAELILLEHVNEDAEDMHAVKPAEEFLEHLRELERNKQIFFPEKNSVGQCPPEKICGLRDGNIIYVYATASYNAVNTYLKHQDRKFPIGATQLWKDMNEDGYIVRYSNNDLTATKRIGSSSQRAIQLKREMYDCDEDASSIA